MMVQERAAKGVAQNRGGRGEGGLSVESTACLKCCLAGFPPLSLSPSRGPVLQPSSRMPQDARQRCRGSQRMEIERQADTDNETRSTPFFLASSAADAPKTRTSSAGLAAAPVQTSLLGLYQKEGVPPSFRKEGCGAGARKRLSLLLLHAGVGLAMFQSPVLMKDGVQHWPTVMPLSSLLWGCLGRRRFFAVWNARTGGETITRDSTKTKIDNKTCGNPEQIPTVCPPSSRHRRIFDCPLLCQTGHRQHSGRQLQAVASIVCLPLSPAKKK